MLAVERYGKGRSAAFTVDTTYLWDLPLYGMGQDSPYNRLWGQLIRWLAGTDVRNRQHGAGVEGLLNKTIYQLGESVRLRAMVRDDHGDATRYAQVSLTLKTDAAARMSRPWASIPWNRTSACTTWSSPTRTRATGSMELKAMKDGKELGHESLKFTVIPPADEMLKIAANPKLMGDIAEATHGSACELAGLPALLDELIRGDKHAPVARQVSVPLHNFIRAALAFTGRARSGARAWICRCRECWCSRCSLQSGFSAESGS